MALALKEPAGHRVKCCSHSTRHGDLSQCREGSKDFLEEAAFKLKPDRKIEINQANGR